MKNSSAPIDPQTFWLAQLQTTDRLTDWTFAQIAPHLGDRVLELGCGTGNYTLKLAEVCQQVVAIDRDPDYIAALQQRLQSRPESSKILAQVADVTALDRPSLTQAGKFDAIVLLDLLEHIQQDVDLLAQFKPYLHPQGKVILKVPAGQWLYSPMDRAIGHHRRYKSQTLRQTLTQAGFTVTHLHAFNLPGIAGWWLFGKLLQRSTPPAETVGWFNALVPIFQTLEAGWTPPIGLCLIAVAIPADGDQGIA